MPEFELTEKRVLESNWPTLRNIEEVGRSFGLKKDQFINLIKGKRVLDIGAGQCGLAIDAALRGVDAEIVSVEPFIGTPNYEENQLISFKTDKNHFFTDFHLDQIQDARLKILPNTFPYFAHDLSAFANDDFDVIIDHMAVFGYFQQEAELPAFIQSLHEERRVLKAAHPIYVFDCFDYSAVKGQPSNWKEKTIQDLGLNYSHFGSAFSLSIFNSM